jgi:putative phosphoserine phosphatase/1-acylglycerol-3-phosphate O-acyltransferase
VPNVLNVLEPPRVSAVVGAPVTLEHSNLAADTKRIMRAISDLLPPESQLRYVPTPEELAATYPPGYKGDPERETARRPGSD